LGSHLPYLWHFFNNKVLQAEVWEPIVLLYSMEKKMNPEAQDPDRNYY